MATLIQDGFDIYQNSTDLGQAYTSASCTVSKTAGRFGGGCVQITSASNNFQCALPTTPAEIWCGFAFNPTGSSTDGCVLLFNSVIGKEASLYYNQLTSTWTAYEGDGSITLGNATLTLTTNAYHWIDVHYLMSNSVGVFEVWVDNVQILNLSGVNTARQNGTAITSLGIASDLGGSNAFQPANIDDLYVRDLSGSFNNGRAGDSKIETLVPSSDAGVNDGVLTTGTDHFAMVDEAQNDGITSTSTLTNTSGQAEVFGMTSISGSPTSIHSLRVVNWVEKSDAGSCFGEALIINPESSQDSGTSTPLIAGAFGPVEAIFDFDPGDSGAWTLVKVAAVKAGFTIT